MRESVNLEGARNGRTDKLAVRGHLDSSLGWLSKKKGMRISWKREKSTNEILLNSMRRSLCVIFTMAVCRWTKVVLVVRVASVCAMPRLSVYHMVEYE